MVAHSIHLMQDQAYSRGIKSTQAFEQLSCFQSGVIADSSNQSKEDYACDGHKHPIVANLNLHSQTIAQMDKIY